MSRYIEKNMFRSVVVAFPLLFGCTHSWFVKVSFVFCCCVLLGRGGGVFCWGVLCVCVFFQNYFSILGRSGLVRPRGMFGICLYFACRLIIIKIWSWETYLDITCGEFVCMSIQELHGCIDFETENSFS